MALLEVEELTVEFRTEEGVSRPVEGLSYELERGETLGIVGESGAGKTVTCRAILGLLGRSGTVTAGSIRYDGRDLRACSDEALRSVRGDAIAMVFQDPDTALNPTYTVGEQVAETIRAHRSVSRQTAHDRAIATFERVGLSAPATRAGQYPHELSGGQNQRVCIAMAIACEPAVLICDEPTTALDVTIQSQLLDLLDDLAAETDMAIQLVTHDLGIVAERCDRALVMYAGQIVERADVESLFYDPGHPYTAGLLASIPQADGLGGIPGTMPDMRSVPSGCRFHPRCPYAESACSATDPDAVQIGGDPGHTAACLAHTEGFDGELTYEVVSSE